MKLWQTNPFHQLTMTSGEGSTIRDRAGNSYLDLLSGTWCNVMGYSHPRWVHAVQEQAEKLAHVGPPFFTQEIEVALMRLKEILPPQLNRAVFLNTGSEAVELSLKLARAYTGAEKIISFDQGYYGATSHALAISEAGRTSSYLPYHGNTDRLPVPDCNNCPKGVSWPCEKRIPCLDQLAVSQGEDSEKIAAIIYEPVHAGAGNIAPPIGYGKRLRELTDQCNGVLIAEEVTTGMGRTGKWFGFQHEDMVPDILVIGKAIGGGLPVAVVVTTEEIERKCKDILVRHVQSHQNDPFSGRIAAEVISIMQDENMIERAGVMGDYFMTRLNELKSSCPGIKAVRGRGLMIGIQLQPELAKHGGEVAEKLLEQGFITNYHVPSNSFRLFPPFIITVQEIDSFIDTFHTLLPAGQ